MPPKSAVKSRKRTASNVGQAVTTKKARKAKQLAPSDDPELVEENQEEKEREGGEKKGGEEGEGKGEGKGEGGDVKEKQGKGKPGGRGRGRGGKTVGKTKVQGGRYVLFCEPFIF